MNLQQKQTKISHEEDHNAGVNSLQQTPIPGLARTWQGHIPLFHKKFVFEGERYYCCLLVLLNAHKITANRDQFIFTFVIEGREHHLFSHQFEVNIAPHGWKRGNISNTA